MNTKQREKILYKDLSYIIQGCCFEIRKEYGPGQKESVYVNLLKECLENKGITVDKEKLIKIYSSKTGKIMGIYKPDLVVNDKIPIEVKSSRFTPKQAEKQLYYYLRNSKYELGYLVNFSTPKLFIKRIIYSNYKKPFLKILSCVFVFFFAWFSVVDGTVLYLEPSTGQYFQGDTFITDVRIDPEGECINTVKVDLGFSKEVLEIIDFITGNSILTLWLQTPKINQEEGLISFIGGIPGGYCGALPGEPGEPNLLGKIIFRAKEIGGEPFSAEAKFLESSEVLLNDGLGTPAKLSFKNADFTILAKSPEIPKKEVWQEELEKDNIPPEPFEIEVHQTPEIFEGKYFLIFQTSDKQTGIDHYEVKEGKKDWKRADSPYLLEDQELKSIIKVKAVDKAGNIRISEYRPTKKSFPWWVIILTLAGIWIIWWIVKKARIKNTESRK